MDIIGASKIDEEILIEIQKEEERNMQFAAEQAKLVAEDAMESDEDKSGDLTELELENAMEGVLGDTFSQELPEEMIEKHDLDGSGTLDQTEIENAVLNSNDFRETTLDEWGDE